MTSSLNNNLSELDTLLQDLSNSRYADKKCKYITLCNKFFYTLKVQKELP